MKSKDGITIYLEKERSGTTYIKLRASVEISGIKKNKRISTGLIYTPENLETIKEEARPIFYKKLGIQLHDSVKFEDFYLDALQYININCNAETARDRLAKVEKYILPFLKEQDIKKIEAGAIERWQLDLLKVISPDLMRRVKRILKRLFTHSILLGYRRDNPVDATSNIRSRSRKPHEIYTRDEVVKMVSYAEPWLSVWILIQSTLWLRSGEMVVLKWNDIDFATSILYVNRAIRRGEFREPKTGKRKVEIPSTLLSILSSYKLEAKESSWLFPNPRGGENYSDAKFVNQNYFQPLLKKIGIKYKGMYELKHTGISLVYSASIKPDFISHQAGHKDKATFLKYYAQFIKDEESIKKVNEILNFNT